MRSELETRLCKKFPSLYEKHFYFDCDDGWFTLIYSMSKKLMELSTKVAISEISVQEGGLLVISDANTTTFNLIVSDYELKSYTICEVCGSTVDINCINVFGRLKTICKECEQKLD